jgi:hypothetical protein
MSGKFRKKYKGELLSFTQISRPRYIEEMRWFQEHIQPLVQQPGLR